MNATELKYDAFAAARRLAPDALAMFKRLIRDHARFVDAKNAVKACDPEDDPAVFQALVDDLDVKRGLFKQAVELEARDFGQAVVAEVFTVLVEVMS